MFTRVAIVVLAVAAVAFGVLASRLASQRDTASAHASSLRSELAYNRGQSAYFSRLASSLDATVGGLQRQVNWDKTHLVYCWTVIVHKIPADKMARPARERRWAALPTGSLARDTVRCATDAVP